MSGKETKLTKAPYVKVFAYGYDRRANRNIDITLTEPRGTKRAIIARIRREMSTHQGGVILVDTRGYVDLVRIGRVR